MKKQKYLPVSAAMYANYISHGFGLVIMMQTASYLTDKLDTDLVGISFITSMMAVGKIAVLAFSGILSDKFGRKPFVFLGIFSYIVFFTGIIASPNLKAAAFFAMFAGAGNSFLDTGSMPAWMEAYPQATGTVTILQKAAVSIGQFLMPILISLFLTNGISLKYVYVIAALIMVINAIVIFRSPFPPMPKKTDGEQESSEESPDVIQQFKEKPKLYLEGICLILIGFTSTSTFTIHSNWMSVYGQQYAGMSESSAAVMLSMYSTASIIAVIVTSILIKKWIKAPRFLVVYPAISVITLLVMIAAPSPAVCRAGAVLVGFTAAGGVLQLAVSTMSDLFPMGKGKVTSVVYMACSICMLVVPAICGYISRTGVSNVMIFNAAVTALGVILAFIVNIRYNKVLGKGHH